MRAMIDEIANLPDISFIDDITLDDVQEQMLADYNDRYEQLTGKPSALSRADPIALLLYASSVQIYQALLYVDRSGKQDLLKYSYGDFLDNLAAMKGITREPAKAATVMVRFTLSGIRPEPVAIPEGTRVTDGELFFATDEYTEIPAGEESATIRCTCQTAGESGNNPLQGEIDTLVDLIAYVAEVSNIEPPAGGADIESDDDLKDRIYIAPSKYSVAGPEDAYRYWAETYNTSISDVYINSDNPVEVDIKFILEGGELPNEAMVEGLQEFLASSNIRPLTDKVTVSAPESTVYDINLTYYIGRSDTGKAASIQSAVAEAIAAFKIWQRSEIGRDVNPSELIHRIREAGAKRVVLTEPTFQRVDMDKIAVIRSESISYGGIEDD